MNKIRNNKKGFTLMEVLIVVAIIAILIAVAIPTFTGALSRANMGVDDANIRSAYAQYKLNIMTDTDTSNDNAPAGIADIVKALDAIGVTELKYYGGVTVPTEGKTAWTGNSAAGTDGATIVITAGSEAITAK